ncbi:hypothetical protein CKM354_000188000 [Cercospora kikuchii]|uniref:BTB domain-containing protein n=1 Tax=Cercospora kikuchii TaxID=84275 RepID=A0A9P3F936_9PEZI|nr:uncharacterized protein CKM354_000188000 [Cercospora kikuchii]GIZ38463.1 hypothetical protein CKM354_000188000 [Cercospora kikuchii]
MTPLHNGTVAHGSNGHRPTRSTGRVLPAIPLAFSKPKQQQPPHVRTSAQKNAAVKASTPVTTSPPRSEKSQNGEVEEAVMAKEARVFEKLPTAGAQQEQEQDAHTRPSAQTPVSRGSGAASLSNGATPEPASSEAPSHITPLTNGHAPASSSTGPNSPASGRKPADRFDMRPIRTELPPAFIPSAEQQQTPLSAASMQYRPPAPPHGHPVHPSAGSIVFGGNESSGSSPAPPPGMGSVFMPPPSAPPPAHNYIHAHHASEPPPQRYQNGHPPPSHLATRQGFAPSQQFAHHHTHVPPRYPTRGDLTPNGVVAANGYGPRSRSGSHASSRAGIDLQSPIGLDQSIDSAKAMYSDHKSTFGSRNIPPPFPHHMGPPPPNFHHPEMAAGMENAESMRDHILSQFRNPAFADCHILVSEEEASAHLELDGHKLILARSPRLSELIRNNSAPTSPQSISQLNVPLNGRYVRIGPFVDSIRYLYGGPLPPFDLYNLGPNTTGEDRVELALQYIATGAWLNIHAVAQRGVEIAALHVQWDTITSILAFALDGGLGQMWPIEDGSEEKTSTCSSDDSSTKPEAGGSPTYEPHSSALLARALEFAAHNLPPNFYIDSSAPQSPSFPRLPVYAHQHESKSSRSDPRLSKIRFGEMANDDHQRPSFATTAVSSVLLSLPFPLLKYLLEHPALAGRLGADTVGSIMRQVVNEREVRRHKALRARALGRDDGTSENQQVQNLYWEESVEPSHHTRAGFRLSRRRRGIDTPTSSSDADVAK